MDDLIVEVRTMDLTKVGMIVVDEHDLLIQDVLNGVGEWSLNLAADHPLADTLKTPGSGIVVSLRGEATFSGPMTEFKTMATAENPTGAIAFKGVSDDIVLDDRLCWPNRHSMDPSEQYPTRIEGEIEKLMYQLVRANCGSLAQSVRRVPNFTYSLDYTPGYPHGAVVKKTIQFQNLRAALVELSWRIQYGFRVIQRGNELVFETFPIVNKTAAIRLSMEGGTLSRHSTSIEPPSVTRAIVAGGTREDRPGWRKFRSVVDDASEDAEVLWGRRIERLVDNGYSRDNDELDEDGLALLAREGGTSYSSQATPSPAAETMIVGEDWTMGDKVAVVTQGTQVEATATGLIVASNPQGLQVGATLGKRAKPERALAYSQIKAGSADPLDGDPEDPDAPDPGTGGAGLGLDGITNLGGVLYATDPLLAMGGFLTVGYTPQEFEEALTVDNGVGWVASVNSTTFYAPFSGGVHIAGTCRTEAMDATDVLYWDYTIENLTTGVVFHSLPGVPEQIASACSGAGMHTIPISKYWVLSPANQYRVRSHFIMTAGASLATDVIFKMQVIPTL